MEKESVLIIVGILVASTILLFGADWLGITGLQSSPPGPAQAPLDPKDVYDELQKRMAEYEKYLDNFEKEGWTYGGAADASHSREEAIDKAREEILKEAIVAVTARKEPNAPLEGGPQSGGSGPAR